MCGVVVASSTPKSFFSCHDLSHWLSQSFDLPVGCSEGERQSIEKSNNRYGRREGKLIMVGDSRAAKLSCVEASRVIQLKLMTVDWLSASSKMCARSDAV